MKQISLLRVKIKNFRSFVDDDVYLPTSPGLRLLSGANLTEPRLGANGAGKTTLWDAICWCQHGTAIKGLRASDLTTWGKADTQVETFWSVDGVEHRLVRTAPPMRVELDGAVTAQADVDRFFGLSKQRFLHSVIFGQSKSLFPDLTLPERSELFDEVLGLSVWAWAAEASGAEVGKLQKEYDEVNRQLSYFKGQLFSLPTEENLDLGIIQWEFRRQEDISRLSTLVSDWERERTVALTAIGEKSSEWDRSRADSLKIIEGSSSKWEYDRTADLEVINLRSVDWVKERDASVQQVDVQIKDWSDKKKEEIHKKADELQAQEKVVTELKSQLSGISFDPTQEELKEEELLRFDEQKLSDCRSIVGEKRGFVTLLKKDLTFWESNDACPTCKRPISVAVKGREVNAANNEIKAVEALLENTIQLATVLERTNRQRNLKLQQFRNARAELKGTKDQLSRQLTSEDRRVSELQATASYLRSELSSNPFEIQKTNLLLRLNPFTEQIVAKTAEVNPFINQIASWKSEVNPYVKMIASKKEEVNPHTSEVDRKKAEINPHIQIKETTQQTRARLTAEADEKEKLCMACKSKIQMAEYWKMGFREIRLYFVGKVLSALQVEAAAAISAQGLQGWVVDFSTETETKSGTTKLGIQIRIKAPGTESWTIWEAWSGGEQQRLRLAIAKGFGSLIQRAAGVNYSMEIWDEPDAHLSDVGLEDLLESLRYRSNSQNKAIWLVTHSGIQFSGFSEVYQVVKDADGSKVRKTS